MEEERLEEAQPEPELPEQPHYVPRPKWQLCLAWLALAVFLFVLVLYYTSMFRGGK